MSPPSRKHWCAEVQVNDAVYVFLTVDISIYQIKQRSRIRIMVARVILEL